MTQIDGGTLLLIIVSAGVGTFGLRLSFILLFGRVDMPSLLERVLRFVPAAVLSALVLPGLVFREGEFSPGNPRFFAGGLAALVAWRTHNTLLTIGVGMAALWVLQAF